MQFSLINLLAGRQHLLGALVLMRGETFNETFLRGTARSGGSVRVPRSAST